MIALSSVLLACLINEALYLERMAALTDDDGDGFHENGGGDGQWGGTSRLGAC